MSDHRPGSPLNPGTRIARGVLARRLVVRHGLDPLAAYMAVTRVDHGLPTEHEQLVRAEARAVVEEVCAPAIRRIREALDALTPALRLVAERMQAAAASMTRAGFALAPPPPPRRPDRPAWQSKYGPPARRR